MSNRLLQATWMSDACPVQARLTSILKILAYIAAFLPLSAYSQPAPGNAELEDEFFDSNGVRIHYIDAGQGMPVVLLHGFTSSASSWVDTDLVEALSKDFRVIAMDCRGHGKSDKPDDAASYGVEMREAFTNGKDEQTVAAMAAYLDSSPELGLTPAEITSVSNLDMPLLTIIGSRDDERIPAVDAFARLRPEMKVVVIEGATHFDATARP